MMLCQTNFVMHFEKKSAPAIKTQAWTARYKQQAAYRSEQRSGSGRNNGRDAVETTAESLSFNGLWFFSLVHDKDMFF